MRLVIDIDLENDEYIHDCDASFCTISHTPGTAQFNGRAVGEKLMQIAQYIKHGQELHEPKKILDIDGNGVGYVMVVDDESY
jgi:hypothetical protein